MRFAIVLVLALTGCQHIQLVNHPLPFNDKPTPQQNTPNVDLDDDTLDGIFILENWF